MQVTATTGNPSMIACDVLIVSLFEGDDHHDGGCAVIDEALNGWLGELIAAEAFTGKEGKMLDFPTFGKIPAKRVLIIGLGTRTAFSPETVRIVSAAGIQRARELRATRVVTLLHGAGMPELTQTACAQAICEGAILGGYEFKKYKSIPTDDALVALDDLCLVCMDGESLEEVQSGIEVGTIIAEATNMARDLALEPPEIVTPAYLAQCAITLGENYNLAVEVWDEQRIATEKMNCLLMVGRGSANPPRFIRLQYSPSGEPSKHVCLIGKGLCYDSGGLSLKPASAMQHMKTDMSGAASVLAVMRALAQLKPQVAVTAFIPACENMTGPAAYKVDDVLRARNGKTIEIDNTDAEGRLVLADALSYAAEQCFDEVIDFATLTGACIIALGHIWTGVMGNNQALIDRLMLAGAEVGELMWMLPFHKEVRAMLDSDIADMKNSGGREASAIQGGMFLQEFIGDIPWVHFDIAGTSFLDKARGYQPKGATGVPTRSMIAYLLKQ